MMGYISDIYNVYLKKSNEQIKTHRHRPQYGGYQRKGGLGV